jgi:purine-binding chemotaxis protein CheW
MAQQKIASFFIGDALFGIDILLIREINRTIEITPVDLAHEAIRGLINLRGQLVTIFDLSILLGSGKTELSDTTCCIVLKTRSELADYLQAGLIHDTLSDDMTGFIVDKIGDIIAPDETMFEAPPASISGVNRQFIEKIVKLENELLVILKLSSILSLNKQQQ